MKTITLSSLGAKKRSYCLSGLLILAACGQNSKPPATSEPPKPDAPVASPPPTDSDAVTTLAEACASAKTSSNVSVNQLGFLPSANKAVVFNNTKATEFAICDTTTRAVVMEGTLSDAKTWAEANQNSRIGDFSKLVAAGTYRAVATDGNASFEFSIAEGIYDQIHQSAVKSYYFNRSGIEITSDYTDQFARPAGHPDTEVRIHASAATDKRLESTVISGAKGWYDAGDYNKYTVNSGISTYTLLSAYEHNRDLYDTLEVNIPESNNSLPDLLDEIQWNLDWLLTMQDPNDGGVYHKLTSKRFSGEVMPHQATDPRYVVQKGTAATLNFAAVMAKASATYARFESIKPGYAKQLQEAAEQAWQWAQSQRNVPYQQPKDIQTGEYGDSKFADEFFWAASELFLLTQKAEYAQVIDANKTAPIIPTWQEVQSLGEISLAMASIDTVTQARHDTHKQALIALADQVMQQERSHPYGVAMMADDFVWGSNSVMANKGMVMLAAYRLTQKPEYKHSAQNALDYLLGRNPTGYAFVTGFGSQSPKEIHHRISRSDGISDPIPGMLVGGPHSGQQDKCKGYPSSLPALSYLDDWCSFSTNEIAINWTSPLIYLVAGLRE